MIAYKFPRPSSARVTVSRAGPKVEKINQEPLVLGPIKGKRAGSREEWRLAVAMDRARIPYDYQVSVYGGRRFAGGQVIDFVAFIPFPQPIQVFGVYWHSRRDEAFSLANIQRIYRRPALVAWDYELTSIQDATSWLQRKVMWTG